MTRKQMEAKIEELAAELAEMKKQGQNCCHGTCVHWHYTNLPNYTVGNAAMNPWQYKVYTGGSTYQITTS